MEERNQIKLAMDGKSNMRTRKNNPHGGSGK